MNILSLDASFSFCSIAVEVGGVSVVKTQTSPRLHGQHILPMIDACLSEAGISLADVDVCAFGKGPAGSFTGLRLVAALVQGLSFTHGWKIVPVSGLQALAQAAYLKMDTDNLIVCEDARMQQVYWSHLGLCQKQMQPIVDSQCTRPQALLDYMQSLSTGQRPVLAGGGWQNFSEFESIHDTVKVIPAEALCVAEGLLSLAHFFVRDKKTVDKTDAVPDYVQPLQYQKTDQH